MVSKILEYVCLRCGHQWMPRTRERPRACPKCKSPWWDRDRRERKALESYHKRLKEIEAMKT